MQYLTSLYFAHHPHQMGNIRSPVAGFQNASMSSKLQFDFLGSAAAPSR